MPEYLKIPFKKTYLTGNELACIQEVLASGHLAGDGSFTARCQYFLEQHLGGGKVLLTTSCTDALEMAALLLEIAPGDEVILPAYTFVSTANAFALRGATLRFVDADPHNPNLDLEKAANLINARTKALVVVHYAGFSCNMELACQIAETHKISLIEDAAQALGGSFNGKPLGSFGHLATFSFHDTKNITAGEGGALVVNKQPWVEAAKCLRNKGTNRHEFVEGKANYYEWVSLGSSFLPSEITAAFLWAQLAVFQQIQDKNQQLWEAYQQALLPLVNEGFLQKISFPKECKTNHSMFFVVCHSQKERDKLMHWLASNGVDSAFHYQALHQSRFFRQLGQQAENLPQAERYSQCLLRLPFFQELRLEEVQQIGQLVGKFFRAANKIM